MVRSLLYDTLGDRQSCGSGVGTMSEKAKVRKYPRVGLGVDSAIWSEVWQGEIGGANPVGGVVTVLGAGGAFVEVSEVYEVGSTVGLRFLLPGTREEIGVYPGFPKTFGLMQ